MVISKVNLARSEIMVDSSSASGDDTESRSSKCNRNRNKITKSRNKTPITTPSSSYDFDESDVEMENSVGSKPTVTMESVENTKTKGLTKSNDSEDPQLVILEAEAPSDISNSVDNIPKRALSDADECYSLSSHSSPFAAIEMSVESGNKDDTSFNSNRIQIHHIDHYENDTASATSRRSNRTPIPNLSDPSSFELTRPIHPPPHHRSNSVCSKISDLSDEENQFSEIREEREEQNIGRLVMAAKRVTSAKQHHEVNDAPFVERSQSNCGPLLKNPLEEATGSVSSDAPSAMMMEHSGITSVTKPSNCERSATNLIDADSGEPCTRTESIDEDLEHFTGVYPIDLDSGEPYTGTNPIDVDSGKPWNNHDYNVDIAKSVTERTAKSDKTPKLSNLTGKKMKKFVFYGIPEIPYEDDDSEEKLESCWGKTVCTVGKCRCTTLALVMVVIGLVFLSSGAIVVGILVTETQNDYPTTNSVVLSDGNIPSSSPPTSTRSPNQSSGTSSSLSARPSISPAYSLALSTSPSNRPSSKIRSSMPSSKPTDSQSGAPTLMPSHYPSMTPSSMPSVDYSTSTFSQIGLPVTGLSGSDQSAYSVSISKDGNIKAIGARHYPNSLNKNGSVAVYYLTEKEFVGATWEPMGQVLTGNYTLNEFGYSVDLSDDGHTMAVSMPLWNEGSKTGNVQVYRYNPERDLWEELGSNIEGENENDRFGTSLSISGDGKRIAVGAPFHGTYSGVVRVFSYMEILKEWVPTGLALEGNSFFDHFGWDVSLSGDGMTVACGAPNNVKGGYVSVYWWDEKNIKWRSKGNDIFSPITSRSRDKFGSSISLSENGNKIAIGSPHALVEDQVKTGLVAVYEISNEVNSLFSAQSDWYRMGESNIIGKPAPKQYLGWSVSLSRDGQHLAVGAPGNDFNGYLSGQVLVHKWNGKLWIAAQPLYGENRFEDFGWDVDMADRGNVVVVGAPMSVSNIRSGIARVFRWDG